VVSNLRVLERTGLIARAREADGHPCRLNTAPLKQIADWTERIVTVVSAPRSLLETGMEKGAAISYDWLEDVVCDLQHR